MRNKHDITPNRPREMLMQGPRKRKTGAAGGAAAGGLDLELYAARKHARKPES